MNELEHILSKNYDQEILLKLFQKYFVNWIADGYIGKELNIFEISTIGKKTDKEVLVKLFTEFYGNEENFKKIFETLSDDIKKIFKVVVWGEKFPIKKEDLKKYLDTYIDNFEKEVFIPKDEYLFFDLDEFDKDMNTAFSIKYDIARYIRNFVDNKPKNYYLYSDESSSDLAFKLYRDNNENEFINNMNFYLDFYNSGENPISSSGKILKDFKRNMQKHCGITEYYNDVKGLEFLKTETLCLIFTLLEKKYRISSYFNNKNIKNVIDDFMTTETFDKEESYNYTNLFLNFLKGTRNIWENPEKISEVVKSLVELLKEMPKEDVVSLDNIVKAFIYRDKDIELIAFKDVKDYIYINEANGERAKILEYKQYEDYIIEPFVKSYIFLLGIFGVFEIFYEKPFFKKGLYLKNNYLSKYDGLKYIKLTNLGRYIFGHTDKYELPKIYEKAEVQIDDKRQFVTVVGEAPAKMMFFEKIGTKVKENMFKLTYDSFIKGIKNYDELIERIERFKENIDNKELSQNWEEFFENLEKKFNSVKIEDDYVILKLEDNKELIQIVIKDSRFKKLSLKAEEYHLLVKKENLKEVIKIFSEYGYYIVE